jgi:hypothetical protein
MPVGELDGISLVMVKGLYEQDEKSSFYTTNGRVLALFMISFLSLIAKFIRDHFHAEPDVTPASDMWIVFVNQITGTGSIAGQINLLSLRRLAFGFTKLTSN